MTREDAKREMMFAKRNVVADSWIDQAYDVAIKALSEPEIIHCRNCQYWEREEPFTSIGRCGIWKYAHRKGSDYCSEAREVSK